MATIHSQTNGGKMVIMGKVMNAFPHATPGYPVRELLPGSLRTFHVTKPNRQFSVPLLISQEH
jgi:hypothetical protein